MATKYLTYEGYTFKSGDAPRAKAIGSIELKEGFVLSPERIIYSMVYADYRTQRVELKGNFKYSKEGRLASGTITDITVADKVTGSREIILSHRVSKEFSDASNYSFFNPSANPLDFNAINDSTNYYYNSNSWSTNTAPNPEYFPNIYYTDDRAVVDKTTFPDGWWNNPFATSAASSQSSLTGTAKKADVFALTGTPEFGAGTADRITNFNPKEKDRLQIDVSDFGSDAAGTFRVAKNSKAFFIEALVSTTDFIYLKSTGELYYNEDGTVPGFGDGGIFAIIENKANITTKNVEFL